MTLCDPVDCSPPGASVHGVSWARILEWVAIPFSRSCSQTSNPDLLHCRLNHQGSPYEIGLKLSFFIIYLKHKFNWLSCILSVNSIVGTFKKPCMFASAVLRRGSMWRVYGKKPHLCGCTIKYVALNQGLSLVNRVTGQEEDLDLEQEWARKTWDPWAPLGP